MNRVFLSLGSNMGDRELNLNTAITLIQEYGCALSYRSSYYEFPPYGSVEQEDFLNCTLEIYTNMDPHKLLETLNRIENEMGRVRTIRWGPRIIDIDILFYNDEVINTDNLNVPHPEIPKRLFVLEPLNEIAPEFVHPLSKKTVSELYNKCFEGQES